VLDRPSFRIGGGDGQGPEEVLRVDHAVRDALGIPHRGGQMVQPWAREVPEQPKSVPVALTYTFEAEAIPTGDLFVAIEQPATFLVSVNGTRIDTDADCGWWVDRSLRKLPIDPSIIRLGINEIALECHYTELHPGLEIVYLLGSFGTQVKGTAVGITAPPSKLKLGDWCSQGLAFYGGNVSYRVALKHELPKGSRLFVQIPKYEGVGVRVLVDGQPAGIIGWEPNEVDITDFLSWPMADLCIEVIGHRRNSHGPLHLTDRYAHGIGPFSFNTGGEAWTDDYVLMPCGLTAPPQLVVRK